MAKRAGLARALALDPQILFFDEPSAGLDPISSRNLDRLILQLRDSLGATFVIVSHDLQSIFTIADNAIFLDTNTRTMRAQGNPRELLEHSTDPYLLEFLTRGGSPAKALR
jgi:phospholipid/cholesterol/gamma-HCH transport system ATP-binding protein